MHFILNKYFLKIIFSSFIFCYSTFCFAQADDFDSIKDYTPLTEIVVKSVIPNPNIPLSSSFISKHKIEQRQNTADITYLVASIPSAVAYSDGGGEVGYSGLRIRGGDLTRINVTINGMPYNDAESHNAFFVDINDIASAAKYIQLQRGVGLSSQGTSSFGATLAINTLPEFKNQIRVAGSLGSFLSGRTAVNASVILHPKWSLSGRFSWTTTDGYRNRASANLLSGGINILFKPNAKFESALVSFSGSEKTYLAWEGVSEEQLKINRKHNPLGFIDSTFTYKNQTDNYLQSHIQWINSLQINPSLSLHSTTYFSKGDGYYEEFLPNQDISSGEYNIPVFSVANDTIIRQLHLDNSLLGQQFLLSWQIEKNHKLLWGISENHYIGKHFGKIKKAILNPFLKDVEYYRVPAEKDDIQSFIRYEWNNSKKNIFVFADLQWRNVQYSLRGFRKNLSLQHHLNYHFINPKLGVSYLFKHHKWFLSFAVGQREPIRDDFENTTSHLPKPEELYNIELGYQWKTKEGILLQISAYGMYYNNQFINTGKINDVGASTRENVDKSRRIGIEAEWEIPILKKMVFSGSTALSENKITAYRQYLDNIDKNAQEFISYHETPISFSPSFVNRFEVEIKVLKHLFASLQHQFVGEQFLDNTGSDDKKLPSYSLLNAQIRYHLKTKKSGEFSFSLFLKNILSEKYSHNGYAYSQIESNQVTHYKFLFAAAEFNLHLTANWTLDF